MKLMRCKVFELQGQKNRLKASVHYQARIMGTEQKH